MVAEAQIIVSSNNEEFLKMLGESIGKMQGKGLEADIRYQPVASPGTSEGVIYTALVLGEFLPVSLKKEKDDEN